MDTYSNSATRQALHGMARAAQWLGGCVAALTDSLSSFSGQAGKAGAVVMPGTDGLVLFRVAADGGLDVASPTTLIPDSQNASALAARPVALRFMTERAVVKRIAVPASALDVLPAIIDNKIEGLAPWPAHGAAWGYRVLEPAAAGQIDVEVGIISRKLLDGTLRDAEAAGLFVSHAEIGDMESRADSIVIDFRRPERVQRWRRRIRMAATALSVIALSVAGYGLYTAIAAERELSLLESRAEALRQTLLGNAPSTAASAELSAANKLYDRKRDTPPVAALLNDLTRLVPDGAWLTAFEYSAALVTITGHGVNVTRLIDDLEASPEFETVNFAAATQRDAASGTDVFAISAGISARKAAP